MYLSIHLSFYLSICLSAVQHPQSTAPTLPHQKLLRLPRNLHSKAHKVLHLPPTLHFHIHTVLHLPRNLHFKVHKVLRLPRNLHSKAHKVLRLPPTLHFHIHIKNSCACHKICTPRPRNTTTTTTILSRGTGHHSHFPSNEEGASRC